MVAVILQGISSYVYKTGGQPALYLYCKARESSNSNIQLKNQFKQEIFSNIQKNIQPQKTVTSIFEKPREGFFLLQQVGIDIKFPSMAAKY